MPCTLFLLPAKKQQGGNFSTISRIRSHLVKHGHTCLLWDVRELEKSGDINQVLEDQQVNLIIGIHAFRTGRVMKDCRVPYILILGGTDVNEFSKDEHKLAVMTSAVFQASCVISFSRSVQMKALALWPHLPQTQMTVITQAVITCPSDFNLYRHLQEHCGIADSEDRCIFLLVTAIRPVKNPVYLIDTFTDLHSVNSGVLFVILGPVIDTEYYEQVFLPALQRCEGTGTVYIPGLTFEDTHRAMQQSFVAVNSSESEGMSLAILEAMQLNTPVLARDIPGNSAVIEDSINGLLFSSPQDFQQKASQLLSNKALRDKLVSKAAEYVANNHSLQQEEEAYLNVVQCCCCHGNDLPARLDAGPSHTHDAA